MTAKRSLISWCIYDWANSAYPTVITTFVFATYFTKAIAETPERGTGQLGVALGIGGLVVALTSPVLGAIADRVGARKPWIAVFTALCVVATAMLWYAKPEPDYAVWALTFLVVSSVTFEFGSVFYNAMLPELAPSAMIGRISGWGWGLGYAGGCFASSLHLLGLSRQIPLGSASVWLKPPTSVRPQCWPQCGLPSSHCRYSSFLKIDQRMTFRSGLQYATGSRFLRKPRRGRATSPVSCVFSLRE